MAITVVLADKKTGPTLASGRHAEILAEMLETMKVLVSRIDAEMTRVYDGLGGKFWLERDPILDSTRRLTEMAQQRIVELRAVAQ